MTSFQDQLQGSKEIGFVTELLRGLVIISGLPSAKVSELVVFENDEFGQVLSLKKEGIEVLVFGPNTLRLGMKVLGVGKTLTVGVGPHVLGKSLTPQGEVVGSIEPLVVAEYRPIDTRPQGIMTRTPIVSPLETGVTLIDVLIPLAKGQRQLILGDRKSGKTSFLLQTLLTQARKGVICIYAAIGKRALEIKKVEEFIHKSDISQNTVLISSSSSDPTGIIFLTPYTAMTIAEYFRDQGKDVLVIMDDLSTHSAVYREISLIARRFPGRGAYPGDIFYTHARLLERAGNFQLPGKKTAAISCLAVAQTVLGDLAGYITTNLMSMTDGHLFFDTQLFDEGRRPAINPFLSVTRVGLGAQMPVIRDISRQLSSFLVKHEKLKQYTHFGAEVSQSVRDTLTMGERLYIVFQQFADKVLPVELNIYCISLLWSGLWDEIDTVEMKKILEQIRTIYAQDESFRAKVETMVRSGKTFTEVMAKIKETADSMVPHL